MPELSKAFAYRASRFEGFKIACYQVSDRGFFRAHRDNLSPATAHRRFALTLNLNESYQGGQLRFPAPARGAGRGRRAALRAVVVPVRGGGTPPGVGAPCAPKGGTRHARRPRPLAPDEQRQRPRDQHISRRSAHRLPARGRPATSRTAGSRPVRPRQLGGAVQGRACLLVVQTGGSSGAVSQGLVWVAGPGSPRVGGCRRRRPASGSSRGTPAGWRGAGWRRR
jgi:hypothetical protein